MTGYVRTDTTNNIADGNVISAADLDNEFNGVQAAFNSSTGHTHDGSSAEGAPITKLGPAQDVTISTTVLGVKTTNTVDLGTSSLKFKDFYLAGNALIGGTLGVTGATTLSAALTYGGVTLSNAVTGTGNMVLSASPTLTGTITAAAANFSGAVALNGNTTIGDADTDTITQAASYVTGTQLKSAKTATNTLALAAYDVDGTAYTNLITLTAANAPTLALTSTGVGTINNMSIGATTASTGAFTTLSASSTVTLSGGTANGVAYLDGSKVLTTGTALAFDGTNLGVGSGLPSSGIASAGFSGLQLKNATSAALWGSDYASNLTVNAYPTTIGSVFTRGGTSYRPSKFAQFDGAFYWSNAAAAGTTITWSDLMTLDTSGNLLVGTTTANANFYVYNAPVSYAGLNATAIFSSSASQSTGTGGLLAFEGKYNSGGSLANFAAIGGLKENSTDNNYSGYLGFYTRLNGNLAAERARIDSSGNLGIGVTSPVSILDVNAKGTGTTPNAVKTYTSYMHGSTIGTNVGELTGWGVRYGTIAATPVWYGARFLKNGVNAASDFTIWTSPDGDVTTLAERVTVTASGNLGVNQTSPSFKIDAIGSTTNGSGIVTTLRLKNGGTTANDGAKILFTAGTSTDGAGIGSGGQALDSADLRFYAGGNTERARFNTTGAFVLAGGTTTADGIGITFPATQSASTNANTLDDYEEGTWTPNSTGISFVGTFSSSGTYTKIGRQVTVIANFQATTSVSINAGTGFSSNIPIAAGNYGIDNPGTLYIFGQAGGQVIVAQNDTRFYTGAAVPAVAGFQLSVTYFIS